MAIEEGHDSFPEELEELRELMESNGESYPSDFGRRFKKGGVPGEWSGRPPAGRRFGDGVPAEYDDGS